MTQLTLDDLTVTLGVKGSADAGVIVANAVGGANFAVTLKLSGPGK